MFEINTLYLSCSRTKAVLCRKFQNLCRKLTPEVVTDRVYELPVTVRDSRFETVTSARHRTHMIGYTKTPRKFSKGDRVRPIQGALLDVPSLEGRAQSTAVTELRRSLRRHLDIIEVRLLDRASWVQCALDCFEAGLRRSCASSNELEA